MRFASFFRVQIHSWNAFHEPYSSLRQEDKEQPDTELFLRVASFIYYACGVVEGKKRIVGGGGEKGGGEISQSSLTAE